MKNLNKKGLNIKFLPLLGSFFLVLILMISYLVFYHSPKVSAAWYNSSWAYRKELIVNNTQVSTINQTTLTNFPVLVSITDPDLRSINNNGYVALASGNDIIFTASDGVTLLNYAIENYNPAIGSLNAWVNISSLSPITSNIFYMYYGNANASANSTANAQGTWNANYTAVWHLEESGNGTSGEYKDSTSSGNNGQGGDGNTGKVPTQVTGQIGYAQNLNGSELIYIPTATNFATINSTSQSLSWWYKVSSNPSATEDFVSIIKSGGGSANQATFRGGNLDMSQWGGGVTIATTPPTANQWHFVTWTYNGATNSLYIDGILITTDTTALQTGTPAYIVIGSYNNTPSEGYIGQIDEVEVSKTSLSADWINTEYNNQNSPSTFVSEGNQEQQVASSSPNNPPSTPTLIYPAVSSTNISVLPELQLRSTDINADYLDYYLEVFSGASCDTLLTTADESSSTSGWLNEDANSSTAYSSGIGINDSSVATYQYPSQLSPNQTYSWEAKAIDPGGSDTYSSLSACQSFTTAPSEVHINGGTNINGGTTIN